MIKTYIKILFRNFVKNKSTSLINTIGLAIGLTCCVFIGLYVSDELSFDKHHEKGDRVYQIITNASFGGENFKWNSVPNSVAPYAQKEIPEIEKAGRIFYHNFNGQAFVSTDEVKSMEEQFTWADQEMLDILSYNFLQGNKENALSAPNQVILSEAAVKKYFGDMSNVLNEVLVINNDTELTVSGVFQNPPSNSRFQSPMIGSFSTHFFSKNENLSWSNASFQTYFLINSNAHPSGVEGKLNDILSQNIPSEDQWFTLELKPLHDLHLYMGDIQDAAQIPSGDINQVKILIALGLIVLLIAVVNYVNLSTAQSQKRFKEIGVIKSLGASRIQLIKQFLFETSMYVFVALVLAIQFVLALLPIFNAITGKSLSESGLVSTFFLGIVLLFWVVISALAGFYPAFYLSGFSPKRVLKISSVSTSGSWLRRGLVITQFSLSIILIICTIVLYQQLSFIRSKNLGFQPEQVIAVLTTGAESSSQINALKIELGKLNDVNTTTRSQAFPGISASGRTLRKSEASESSLAIQTVRAESEITDVLSIHLLAGSSLPLDKQKEDTTIQVLLNKTAIEYLGYTPEEAIGMRVSAGFQYPVEIVGVVDDFHFSSLHEKIGAYCFHNARTEGYNYLLVKIQSTNLPQTIQEIGNTFKEVIPTDFQFSFIDQRIETLYYKDQRMADLVLIFSSLAIFIACLGLYALAAFATEQRTKEIGIRKVFGASVSQVIKMLSADFMKLVVVSFVIAAPIGYYVINGWLESFAYRIDINLLVFVLAGIISIVIASLTIAHEAFKAARANPANSLKSE